MNHQVKQLLRLGLEAQSFFLYLCSHCYLICRQVVNSCSPQHVGSQLKVFKGLAAIARCSHLPQKRPAREQALGFAQCGAGSYQPVTLARPVPISARLRTVFTPASSRAANFSSAVPLPPEIIAPA